MRIDSHQHFWNYDPLRHSWIDAEKASIARDFTPDDLNSIISSNHIDGTIAVQADQSEEENRFLLDLASKYSFIKGIVGWIDLRSDELQERLEHYSELDLVKGFRHVVQDEPDEKFMVRPDFMTGISNLHGFGFSYDILVFPNQLTAAIELVTKFPNQSFVLDHIAKPNIKDGIIEGWGGQIMELGKHFNVFCKISGMVTEANWNNWKKDDFYPYMDIVVEAFGMERLMYGSDWPVCTLAADYDQVYELVAGYMKQFSQTEQDLFFGGTCSRFYKL